MLPMQGAWLQSWVMEQRNRVLQVVAKKKKKKKKRKEKELSSLRMTAPSFLLVNLQVDHKGKRTSSCRWIAQARQCPREDRGNQQACSNGEMTGNLTSGLNDSLSFFFPLKILMAEENWHGHKSTFSPDCWLF